MLDCDPADLWPDLFPIMTPPSAGTVAVSVYSSRADVPITVWKQLFEDAAEHLDILVYGGTFLFDGLPPLHQDARRRDRTRRGGPLHHR